MQSCQRVDGMIRGRSVDRVPVALFWNWDYLYKAAGLTPRERRFYAYLDDNTRCELVCAAFRYHECNDLLTVLPNASLPEPRWRWQRHSEGIWQVRDRDGTEFPVDLRGEVPSIRVRGRSRELPLTTTPGPAPVPVSSVSDLRAAVRIESREALRQQGWFRLFELAKKRLGPQAFGMIASFGVFPALIGHLSGSGTGNDGAFEQAMIRLLTEQPLALALRDRIIEQHLERMDRAAETGADAVLLSSYYEGADLISPDMWRLYSKPGIAALSERAHKHGMLVWNWFLGDCLPLLDDLAEAGIDVLMLEQERRGYCSDPVEIRRRIGNAFCVTGWTHELDVIQDRRDAITKRTAAQLEAARSGRYIAGSSYLTDEAPLATVEFYCREVARLGRNVPAEQHAGPACADLAETVAELENRPPSNRSVTS